MLFTIQAEILGVWDFIDLKKDDVNVIPSVPKMPKEFDVMAKLARADGGGVSAEQCESYQVALNHFFDSTIVDFGTEMHEYYERLHALQMMEDFFDSTVNAKLYGTIVDADASMREKLTLLVDRLGTPGPCDGMEVRGPWPDSSDDSSVGSSTRLTRRPYWVAGEFVSKSIAFEAASAPEDSGCTGKKGDDDQAATNTLHSNQEVVNYAIDNVMNEKCAATEKRRATHRKKTVGFCSGIPPPLKTGTKTKPATLESFGRCEWCRRHMCPRANGSIGRAATTACRNFAKT